jgi:hypothetical protein
MNWAAVLPFADKILDLIPDPEAKRAAKLALLQEQNRDELAKITASLSAINSEAQSDDPYTSRARPSFLYVVYILMLTAPVMGIVYAISPEVAGDITRGFQAWLAAIPEPIITLFGVGYLGYTGSRGYEKIKGKA